MKTPLPGDETSMSGMLWGELQLTQAGLGPRKPGSHGARWQGATVGGFSAGWRLQAWRPRLGETWEGQPQAVGVPTGQAQGSR